VIRTNDLRAFAGAFRLQRAGIIYALILLIIVFQILTSAYGLPAFTTVANLRNLFDQTALDGVLVISMTILLITGNFDLSIGATAGLAGATALIVANTTNQIFGGLAALGVGIGIGLINGLIVQLVGINAFIVTLGTLTAVQGFLLIATSDKTVLARHAAFQSFGIQNWTLPQPVAIILGIALLAYSMYLTFKVFKQTSVVIEQIGIAITSFIFGLILLAIGTAFTGLLTETTETWIMIAYMAVAGAIMRYTVIGRRLYATGGNPEAARLSGININVYKIAPFVVCSMSAGLAGLMYAGKFGAVTPTSLVNEELPVLAAAILGGTSLFGGSGYIVKSVIGALILSTLVDGFNLLNLNANYQYVIQGAVIIGAATIYTVGMYRRRVSKRKLHEAEAKAVTLENIRQR
jgi:D-xylose transport system permease protein